MVGLPRSIGRHACRVPDINSQFAIATRNCCAARVHPQQVGLVAINKGQRPDTNRKRPQSGELRGIDAKYAGSWLDATRQYEGR
jgi:hypothetical protein